MSCTRYNELTCVTCYNEPYNELYNNLVLSNRIKDAGIAIRHLRERILFHTAGSRNGLKALDRKGTRPKMDQFEPTTVKIRVSTFWRSGNPKFSRRRPMPACSPVSFKQSRHVFAIFGRASSQIFKKIQKMWVLARWALTLVLL